MVCLTLNRRSSLYLALILYFMIKWDAVAALCSTFLFKFQLRHVVFLSFARLHKAHNVHNTGHIATTTATAAVSNNSNKTIGKNESFCEMTLNCINFAGVFIDINWKSRMKNEISTPFLCSQWIDVCNHIFSALSRSLALYVSMQNLQVLKWKQRWHTHTHPWLPWNDALRPVYKKRGQKTQRNALLNRFW